MTVKKLIECLNRVEDKNIEVLMGVTYDGYHATDIERVLLEDDCVVLDDTPNENIPNCQKLLN